MYQSTKIKPIPFSSIQAQCSQLLKQKQPKPKSKTVHTNITIKYQQNEQDLAIPSQHNNDKYNNNNECMIDKPISQQPHHGIQKNITSYENNKLIKTYASVAASNSNVNSHRLTHGLTNYRDIKSSFNHNNNSNSKEKDKDKDKNKESSNISEQKSKRKLKLQEQYINKFQYDSIQCTFTPKVNVSSTRNSYKNFKDFVNFQQNFLSKKEQKIKKLRKQLLQKQQSLITSIPVIDKKSRKMLQNNSQYQINSYGSLKKLQKKTPTYERLYNIPRKKDRVYEEESTFTPNILSKSKSMIRSNKVQDLLYEDAQRRIGQQKLIQSQSSKKQQIASKYPPNSSLKKVKHNNKLLCRKIRAEFLQLLQTSWNQNGACTDQISSKISPILAVTIISELFNVQLNPNKNQELVWLIVSYLIVNQCHDAKSCQNSAQDQEVETKRLWEFIKAILIGHDGYEPGVSSFTLEQFQKINVELGYFYTLRLSKFPNKLQQIQENEPQYKIESSKNTNKLAQIYRNKKLQQISTFISQAKIVEPASSLICSKQHSGIKQAQLQQRLIRLQDLFILDSIRKKAQLQQIRLRNQQNQLRNCTFRPNLSEATTQIAKNSKNRSRSRDNLRTITQCAFEQNKQLEICQNKQKTKKIIIKSKNAQNRLSLTGDDKKNQCKQNNNSQTCRNIKDVDKTLLRFNIARKMKDVQANQRQRGYMCNSSSNWLKSAQNQKKKVLEEVSNFLGYKDSSLQKNRKFNQIYQSCQIK